MKPPIFNSLMKYVSKQRIKFCTPGHKGKIRMRTDNLCRIDVEDTLAGSYDLGIKEAIYKSEEEVSGIFASARSYYLTAGCSAGIYAVLASVCVPGDKVIIDPECDKAIINAITILALQPVFLNRNYCEKYSINGGISTEKIESAFESCPDAKLVIITSPTYYGVCANLKKLTSIAHERNIPVMVDESFGAHFTLVKSLPESALDCGADFVVQSLSKTLGGFSGCALLHLSEGVDNNIKSAVEANLDIYQGDSVSTSLLCASENIILYAFANAGKYQAILREIERGKEIIDSKTDILWFDAEFDNKCNINVTDKTKIVLNFSEVDADAADIADIFINKYGIEPDYADHVNIVFSVSLYNTPSEIRKLINSCLDMSRILNPVEKEPQEENEFIPELFDEGPNAVMSPYKAFYGSSEWVSLENSLGKICKRVISKLPQGTPIIIPGEKINQDQIELIQSLLSRGVTVYGLSHSGRIEVLTLSDSFYF